MKKKNGFRLLPSDTYILGEYGWLKDRIFSIFLAVKLKGSFTNIYRLLRVRYRSKHNCKNLIETLYTMQRDRIPRYQTEYGLFAYSQLKERDILKGRERRWYI